MLKHRGFTLIELIIVIGIIALLSTLAVVALGGARVKARDTRRRAELSQIGRFFSASSCFLPSNGAGDYDLADLFTEIKSRYPQASAIRLPTDPKSGSATKTNYRYLVVSADQCILYANLEKSDETITIPSVSAPSVGVGTGVLRANSAGVNGTDIYFQYSK